jgi:hypothetical protein
MTNIAFGRLLDLSKKWLYLYATFNKWTYNMDIQLELEDPLVFQTPIEALILDTTHNL